MKLAERTLVLEHERSQRAFYAALARGTHDSRLSPFEGGVQATVVPARPWFTIFNSVLFTDPQCLAEALCEVETLYSAAGVKAWRVWVPPHLAIAERLLEFAGYRRAEHAPALMAQEIERLDLEPRRALDLERSASWEMLARLNDASYGVLSEYSTAAAFATMDDPHSRLYIARLDRQPAAGLLARQCEGDVYFWFVATLPEARGQGLASELIRTALREARARGARTTSLEASAMGERVYRALGFESFGRLAIWERFLA